ncbi:MAG: SEC-C domain-containing protein [Alphaproteobacteria bacterium]|nr:SEC-C domain-containing protein [Alphaproteobacteria bacterium]
MLERAQGKVEAMHFEVRKSILKFDNVMNDQRKIIYEQRREIMESNDLGDLVKDMREQVIEDTVSLHIPPGAYAEQWDTEGLKTEIMRLFGLDIPTTDWAKEEGIADEEILKRIEDLVDRKMAEKAVRHSPDVWRRVEKSIVLQLLDQSWKEHLLALDHLRQGINLRAFGQKDPLNEYKAEAFAMFELMLDNLRELVTQTLSFVEVNPESGRLSMVLEQKPQETHETRQDPAMEGQPSPEQQAAPSNVQPMPVRKRAFDKDDPSTWGKVQRNADCPCGSGKKYKHCHGAITNTATR